MSQPVEVRSERITFRATPSERIALHRIARKHGGMSKALRHMIGEYRKQEKESKAKSATTYQGEGALQPS